jgi:hypothetical protein
MFNADFIFGFLLTSLLSLAGIILCQEYVLKDNHLLFLLGSFAYFVISSFFVHFLATNAVKSKNKYSFTRISMLNTFVKLMVLVLLVVVYKTSNPDKSIDFVWPFFLCYIIFTIFETRFLMKLAKS